LILHRSRKYIVETKIWEGNSRFANGKKQLAAYALLEGTKQAYYVVFDHRQKSEPLIETDNLDGVTIRSYVIPVMQTRPTSEQIEN